MNDFTDGNSNSFIESASWADDVRNKGSVIETNWHFINQVYDLDGSEVKSKTLENIIDAFENID